MILTKIETAKQIYLKNCDMECYENPTIRSRIVTCEQIDGEEPNWHSLQLIVAKAQEMY
jgi:hypothetical protein